MFFCFDVVHSLKKEDFLKNSHITSYLIKKCSLTSCVFWSIDPFCWTDCLCLPLNWNQWLLWIIILNGSTYLRCSNIHDMTNSITTKNPWSQKAVERVGHNTALVYKAVQVWASGSIMWQPGVKPDHRPASGCTCYLLFFFSFFLLDEPQDLVCFFHPGKISKFVLLVRSTDLPS